MRVGGIGQRWSSRRVSRSSRPAARALSSRPSVLAEAAVVRALATREDTQRALLEACSVGGSAPARGRGAWQDGNVRRLRSLPLARRGGCGTRRAGTLDPTREMVAIGLLPVLRQAGIATDALRSGVGDGHEADRQLHASSGRHRQERIPGGGRTRGWWGIENRGAYAIGPRPAAGWTPARLRTVPLVKRGGRR